MKFSTVCLYSALALQTRAFVILSTEQTDELFKKPCPGHSKAVKASDEDLIADRPVKLEYTGHGDEDYLSTAWSKAIDQAERKIKKSWHDRVQQILGSDDDHKDHPKPPHPPHEGHPPPPPHHGPPPHDGHGPHFGPPHHDYTNGTIYQNLEIAPYAKKIFELVNKYDDVVEVLNSTEHNITFFAPVDEAFEKIPEHGKKPSKEFIEKLLVYHVGNHVYPASHLFHSHTVESALEAPALGSKDAKQRIKVSRGFRGLYLNLFSRVVAANYFASNGVAHGIDRLLIPPPPAYRILEILPGQFSTLVNALYKTKVIDAIKDSEDGLTIFAPTNRAFERLGTRILAYLFSPMGEKYLKALMEYHIVKGSVLYSDAYLGNEKSEDHEIPKGKYHADLETLLGKNLSIDIARYGAFISFKINGFTDVYVLDGVAMDGVIHIPTSILIPPKKVGDRAVEANEDMSLEEFKERLETLF